MWYIRFWYERPYFQELLTLCSEVLSLYLFLAFDTLFRFLIVLVYCTFSFDRFFWFQTKNEATFSNQKRTILLLISIRIILEQKGVNNSNCIIIQLENKIRIIKIINDSLYTCLHQAFSKDWVNHSSVVALPTILCSILCIYFDIVVTQVATPCPSFSVSVTCRLKYLTSLPKKHQVKIQSNMLFLTRTHLWKYIFWQYHGFLQLFWDTY